MVALEFTLLDECLPLGGGLTATFLFLAKSDCLMGAFRTVNSDAVVVDNSNTAAVEEVVGMQFSLSAPPPVTPPAITFNYFTVFIHFTF